MGGGEVEGERRGRYEEENRWEVRSHANDDRCQETAIDATQIAELKTE